MRVFIEFDLLRIKFGRDERSSDYFLITGVPINVMGNGDFNQ
jgi:hypothetical protein